MELEQLEKLRLRNQDLLQRLKANQEEFRKRLAGKSLSPTQQSKTPQDRRVPDPIMGKESQDRVAEEFTSIVRRASRQSGPQLAKPGLGPPSKPTTPHKEGEQETSHRGSWHPDSDRTEKASVPLTAAEESAQAAGKTVKKCNSLGDPERKSIPASQTDSETHPAPLQRSRAGAEPNQLRAQGSHGPKASARMPQAPKSILLTPQCKETNEKKKKEAGHVTFVSDPEEYTLPADDWSVRPFLGYDWIAGLLDMDSSVSEKPEQYFSELQDFRRVNRDACIYDGWLRSDTLASSVVNQELETESTSHQCVFCYRLNRRLFAVPMGSESACPICKTLRTQRPPETLVEPAFVRVSIPRSTLLPAYRHKIHRRKSYEPADDLALPSHCLAGWENPIQALSPTLSSLDLRTTLAAESSGRLDWVFKQEAGWPSDSSADPVNLGRILSRGLETFSVPEQMRQLLVMWLLWNSRLWLPGHVGCSSLQADVGGERIHWSGWQPWICMCNLHKQVRIRHLVAWAANLTLPLQASPGGREFWEEKPCFPQECIMCRPEECLGGSERSGLASPSESFPPADPHDSEIPLPPSSDPESYDSLPVVDDVGEE